MLQTGEVLSGRYEILQKIGTGGMAIVYRAKDRRLNRDVAVKVLKEEFVRDREFVSKFRAEAQAAAGLSHPNIVGVYDVGESGSIYYIVMELIEGITLKEYILRKHRLEVRETIGVAIQVASGLEAAHARHLIHRDIKPQNIIISRDGKIKVTDFGIARAITDETTNMYRAAGSVHYISPEQAKGGYCDERSDIYSLGITMYEMATGKLPFDGETTVAVAIAQMNDDPVPPSKIVPSIPVALEEIILKCIQKNPDLRYGNCAELISDLRQAIVTPQRHFVKFAEQAVLPASADGVNVNAGTVSGESRVTANTIQVTPMQWRRVGRAVHEESSADRSPFARPLAEEPQHSAGQTARPRAEQGGGTGRMQSSGSVAASGYGARENASHTANRNNPSPARRNGPAAPYRNEGNRRRMASAGQRNTVSGIDRAERAAEVRASAGSRRAASSAAKARTVKASELPATGFDHALTFIGGTLGLVILVLVIYIGISVRGFLSTGTTAAQIAPSTSAAAEMASDEEAVTTMIASEGETLSENQTEVPDLLGMTITQAREALEKADLVYKFSNSYESSDKYEAGLVCKQQYSAGTIVKKNTTVKISISLGSDKIVLNGEDYIGSTLNALQYVLNASDVDVDYIATESDEPKNTILSIEPMDATLSPGDHLTVYYSKGPSTVAVASLIGLTQDQAATRLSALGLTLGNVTQEYNASVDVNLVSAQSIAAGTVVQVGSSVDITISLGPRMLQVPSVVGMGEGDATSALQNAGFTPSSAYENSSSPAGTVIRQSPEAGGWYNQYTTVTIVVSSGPAQVPVPSVTGMTQDQAASALASAGLVVSWTTANSDVAAGTVTYQNIAAGTAVDAGTTITCEVSAGPASTTAGTTAATTAAGGTTVPAVTGTSQEAATAALQAAGLSVNWTQSYNTAAAGTVTYQNLPAGTSVAPGTTITCEVSLGPQP